MMFHYYFLTMALCIAISYIGMFGFFKLFDDNSPQQNDVVAIATAPTEVKQLVQIVTDEPKIDWNPHEDMEIVAQEAPSLSSTSPP